MPVDAMSQCAHTARITPRTNANGTWSTRQRRVRQPMAPTSTTALVVCTVAGTHPCINEISAMRCRQNFAG
jgi:hypothetical protein